jgi:hypothetical protein
MTKTTIHNVKTTPKTIFTSSTSIKTSSSSLITSFNSIDELVLIKKLLNSNFVINIKNVIRHYYNGNFIKVLELLSKENLIYYSTILFSYKKNPNVYPTYENIRLIFKLYLEGLTKSITQYLELENIKIQLTKCHERSEILDDIEKLKKYIDKLNSTITIFQNIEPVHIAEAKILPEHATYIRLYGYPVGGIFDPQLLKDIIDGI